MSDLSSLLQVLNPRAQPSGDGPPLAEAELRRIAVLAERVGVFRSWWLAAQSRGDVPVSILEEMAERAADLARGVMAATLECRQAVAAVQAQGIPVVTLKGLCLAELAYGDPLARQLADLDLLVAEEHIGTARRALEALGYEAFAPSGRGHVPVATLGARGEQILLDAGHEIVFMPATASMPIELHWRLTPRFFQVAAPIPDLIARRRDVQTLDSVQLPALSAEDGLLALAVEVARDGWADLEHLQALSRLAGANDVDWDLVHRRATAWRCNRLLEVGLLVAAAVTGQTPAVASSLRVRRLAESLAAPWLEGRLVPDRDQRLAMLDLRARDSTRDALLVLLEYCFRPTVAEYLAFGAGSPRPLLGLARASRLVARRFASTP